MANSVNIADLTITIRDNASDAATSVTNLAEALAVLKNNSSGIRLKTVANGLQSLNDVKTTGLKRLSSVLDKMVRPAERLAEALDTVSKSFATMSKSASSSLTKATKTVDSIKAKTPSLSDRDSITGKDVSGLDTAKAAAEELTKASKGLSGATKEASDKAKESSKSHRSFGEVLKSLSGSLIPNVVTQFMRMLKMRIMRNIIRHLLAGFTEGLQNVYYWAKATGNQFAQSMDTIKTSLNYAKNSIGAAFSTVLNAVAPIIDKLVDILVTGINYVNMFFAALQGKSTYTRAKKVGMEWAAAVTDAAGGASGAVEEVKEALSVLDFDELHQLQEAATPSGGGSGGGGSGGNSGNYNDMFEEAKVEDNWLTKTATWLKDNFNDILPIVVSIGSAIAAWKISDALATSLGTMLTLKDKLGITLMVAGFTLEALSAYDMGKNGATLKNVLMTAGGALAAALGGIAKWGVATGLEITIPIAVAIFVASFALGKRSANIKEYEASEFYQQVQAKLNDINQGHEYLVDLTARINSLNIESDERVQNVNVARTILDELREWDGLKITPDVDTTQLDTLLGMLNSLNLDGVVGQWDNVNGVISINIDEIQNAIDKYDEYVRHLAAQDLLIEAWKGYYNAKSELTDWQAKYEQENDNFNTMLDNYEYGVDLWSGYWQPGQPVSIITDIMNPEAANQQRAINDQLKVVQGLEENAGLAEDALDAAMKKILEFRGELGLSTDTFNGFSDATEEAAKDTEGFTSEVSDASKNVPTSVSSINNSLGDIGKGVDLSDNATEICNDLVDNLAPAGTQAKNAIESAIGETGDDLDGQKIMTRINSVLALGGKNVPFKDRGTDILSAIGLAMYNDFNGSSVMEGWNSKLKKAKQSVSFDSTGKAITSDIQGGSKTFDAAAFMTAIGERVSKTSGSKQVSAFYSGLGQDLSSIINYGMSNGFSGKQILDALQAELKEAGKDPNYGNYATSLGEWLMGMINSGAETSAKGAAQGILWAYQNAVAGMDFTPIGTNIAGQIKWGIANDLNNSTLEIATYSPTGVLNRTKNTIYSWTYASGGYPDTGTVFVAGEAGAEAVGTINGRTGVANSDQIASAIAMAMRPMLGQLGSGTQTTNVELKLDSATIARASMKGQRAMNQQYNLTARA